MAISLQLQSAGSNQQAQSQSPTSQPPQTPVSPNSRPSTADSSSVHNQEKTSVPTATQEKRKTNRRANTAERRATHNAVERQRRETLNGRFLDLAALLPNLTSVRRPSKSAIVNSSIALVHAQRRQRALACLELSTLYTQFQALKAEADEWRARAGIGRVEEGERSREFMEFVREGERWAGACGGIEEGRRRGREVEIGGEEERANRLAEAASCTGQQNLGGGLRGMDDDEDLGPEEDEGMHTAIPMPTHHVVPTSQAPATNNHLAHQQHLAQVHAQAQAQIAHAQQVQAQAQAQAQQLNMRARANTFSTPQQHQQVHAAPVHHQSTPLPVQYHHVQQQQPQQHVVQVPFDNGAELYSDLGLYNHAPAHQTHYTVQSQQQQGPFSNFDLGAYNVGLPMPINVKTEPSLASSAGVNSWPISPLTSDSPASSHSHSSPSPSIGSVGSGDGRSRAGSLSMPVPVVGGGGQGGVMGLFY